MTTVNSPQTEIRQPAAAPRKAAWKRQLAALSRWLHIYLSMASFGILFFFAVTGLTVNHTEWFAKQQRTTQTKATLDREWVADAKAIAKLEIVEHLRRAHNVNGMLSDFRVDEQQCAVSFKGPGYAADTFIDRATGGYELNETRMGLGAVLNDLHKGRDTGRAWSIMIDVSAVLMTLVSLSGLCLIFFLYKRRFSGLMAAAVGAALCYMVYAVWVP